MSSTDTRTVDPAQPHHSENGGHEMSDFSWTTVLWLIPLSVIVLIVFFAISIVWFQGAKDAELELKQSAFTTPALNELHAKEGEILSQYKWLDKEKGRVQIPVARAMELMAKENQNSQGREYVPITDTYLEGAAFDAGKTVPAATDAVEAQPSGNSTESAHATPVPAKAEKMHEGQHSEKKH